MSSLDSPVSGELGDPNSETTSGKPNVPKIPKLCPNVLDRRVHKVVWVIGKVPLVASNEATLDTAGIKDIAGGVVQATCLHFCLIQDWNNGGAVEICSDEV